MSNDRERTSSGGWWTQLPSRCPSLTTNVSIEFRPVHPLGALVYFVGDHQITVLYKTHIAHAMLSATRVFLSVLVYLLIGSQVAIWFRYMILNIQSDEASIQVATYDNATGKGQLVVFIRTFLLRGIARSPSRTLISVNKKTQYVKSKTSPSIADSSCTSIHALIFCGS